MREALFLMAYGTLIGLTFLCVVFERGDFLDGIPPAFSLIAGIGGAILGFLASAEASRLGWLKSGYRKILWIIGMTFFGIFAAWIVTDSIALRVAFAGNSAKTEMVLFDVVGRNRSRRKGLSTTTRYSLLARQPSIAATVRVKATWELYDKVGPKPASGENCIKLPVKTGRWGLRAVWVPNSADRPLDLSDLSPCGGTASF
jgi:hypothetical protein